MTISTTIIKNSYSGDGSVVAFTYAFKITDEDFIQVIVKTNATGAESVRAIGTGSTNYAVTGVGEAAGGTVTFVTAPTSAETVVLRRSTTQTQALDLIENDNLPANSLENAFDKNLSIAQELQEQLDRSIKISRANTMTSTEFIVSATDRANKILSFDANGEIAVAQELGTFKGNSATTTTAAYVVRDIVKGTTTAQANNIYICIQASPIGTALTNTSYWVLIVDAVSAAASETAAETAEANAETAQAAAETARDASVVAKDASVAAKDLAVTAKNEAATSATAAAASADAFDDVYLGSKSSAPTADNDGAALAAGMLYFNTGTDQMNVYSGSAWVIAAISSTGVVTLAGTETLTNKTLTSPVINSPTGDFIKIEGTNFTNSLLVGHATTGTLDNAQKNTGVGIIALDALTSGDDNTALGYKAGSSMTTGSASVYIGAEAGRNTLGGSNTVVGAYAFQSSNNANSYENTAVGSRALGSTGGSVTALRNTALGRDAGYAITSGDYNLALGYDSGDNITTGSGNVTIGTVDVASATGSRQLAIGGYDGSTTTTWITGSSAGVVTLNAANVTQQAITSSSNAVAWDASAKPNAVHITTENTTFSAPSNSIEGAFICVEINYNGSHSIAWNTVFEFAASTAPTFTSTDGKTDIMVFRYSGAVWQEVGRTLNLSEA